jgi:uncharacterized protein (DUF2147 family)
MMRHHAFAAMGFATAALFAPGSTAQAASVDPTGYWMKPDAERESKIQVFKCGSNKQLLCAKIIWLKDPEDSKGRPLTDIRNENPAMRGRKIVGLTIFTGLSPSAPATWTGKIYNPEDGQTYSATLTLVSRTKIMLKGCKAWLLCGERQWLRTAAPEELTPAVPAEGTQQIEASVVPPAHAKPFALAATEVANAEAEVPGLPVRAPAREGDVAAHAAQLGKPSEAQAAAHAEALPEPPTAAPPARIAAIPVSLVTQEAVAPAPYNWRQGYRFLSVSVSPDAATRLSGENVPSMFVMANPIMTGGEPIASEEPEATAAIQSGKPIPLPEPKPNAKPKAVVAAATAKPPAKSSEQAAPVPQDANAETAIGNQTANAEASMGEESTLTRRQKRLLRRQQQQQEPFLPWLR